MFGQFHGQRIVTSMLVARIVQLNGVIEFDAWIGVVAKRPITNRVTLRLRRGRFVADHRSRLTKNEFNFIVAFRIIILIIICIDLVR